MSRSDARVEPSTTPLELALKWAQLPAEHLEVSLKALEPQLVREHEFRMQEAQLALEDAKDRRQYFLYWLGLVAGFLLAVGMLTGAVVVGTHGQTLLASLFAGPTVLSLVGLFVLRRQDPAVMRSLAQAQRAALNADARMQSGATGAATGPAAE